MPNTLKRLVVAATVVAASCTFSLLSASTASAEPLCYEVTAESFLFTTQSTGHQCLPYGYDVICEWTTVGISPTLVYVYACVPAP